MELLCFAQDACCESLEAWELRLTPAWHDWPFYGCYEANLSLRVSFEDALKTSSGPEALSQPSALVKAEPDKQHRLPYLLSRSPLTSDEVIEEPSVDAVDVRRTVDTLRLLRRGNVWTCPISGCHRVYKCAVSCRA